MKNKEMEDERPLRKYWYSEHELMIERNHNPVYQMRTIEGKLFTSWGDEPPYEDAIFVCESKDAPIKPQV